MQAKVIKVGIFMGGPSLEKEVSFNSGRTIFDYLDRQNYIPIPIFITEKKKLFILPWQFIYRGKISDFEDRLDIEATPIFWQDLPNIIDFAYLALHGFLGEDGNIQGLLTIFDIPFSGSSLLTNAMTTDKHFMHQLLKLNNINTPSEIIKKKNNIIQEEIYDFQKKNKQIVIKPNQEGSSIGVSIISCKEDLKNAIKKAEQIHPSYTQDVVIQQYIDGGEFTIIAIEKNNKWEIFEPTEIDKNTNFYSYNQKYLPGSTNKYTPARFDSKIIDIIKNSTKQIIDIINPNDIIRIDGIIENETNIPYYIDINAFPGTSPTSFVFLQGAQAGYNPADIINIIIQNGLERYHKNNINHDNKIFPHNTINNEDKKIKIAILLGGNSNEKEISLESGRNVYYKLSKQYFDATPIFVTSNNEYYKISLPQIAKDTTKEIEDTLQIDQKITLEEIKENFDFVFLGLHGGDGENGTLQKKLETIDIPYNGPLSETSHICMNKSKTLDILDQHNLHTTERMVIKKNNRNEEIENNFILYLLKKYIKIIIKPNDDGCSAFVVHTNNLTDAQEDINSFFIQTNKLECLIEGAINGIEITAGVIGNSGSVLCLPITQTVKSENILSLEEKFLPGAGENITPAPFDELTTLKIQNEIKKCYEILNCQGYSRIDCFWIPEKQELIFLEVNTLPALTPATCLFHQAAEIGICPIELINYIIYLGFSYHNNAYELSNHFLQNIEKIKNTITYAKK